MNLQHLLRMKRLLIRGSHRIAILSLRGHMLRLMEQVRKLEVTDELEEISAA